jgi:hypothetical protein
MGDHVLRPVTAVDAETRYMQARDHTLVCAVRWDALHTAVALAELKDALQRQAEEAQAIAVEVLGRRKNLSP